MKAINEINLNEEYMDASVVITMEWHDKNLEWKTGKIELLNKQQNKTDEVVTSNDDKNQDGNKTESNGDSKGWRFFSALNTYLARKILTERDTLQVNINSIRADKSQVWIPEIEILNRVNDFSPIDEKQRQLKILSSGKVKYTRAYRMRAMLTSSLSLYPYDVQVGNVCDEKSWIFNKL